MATDSAFVNILETDALTDIALIKAALDSAEIEYFFQGENMKFIDSFQGPARLMVSHKDAHKVIDLLKTLRLSFVRMTFPSRA